MTKSWLNLSAAKNFQQGARIEDDITMVVIKINQDAP
jgi:serine phosphatase RsbU (regulator of sigma subunit)